MDDSFKPFRVFRVDSLEFLEWTLKIPTQKFIYERINTQGTMLAICLTLLTGEEKRNFMLKINREHMLELTRRMTVSRTAMTRIAGLLYG